MKLYEVEKAIQSGATVRGFRSGGGLRVIRVELNQDLIGYGEHPNVEDALSHANEDLAAGGRPYAEVYGLLKPHYLTGGSRATSPLDAWLLGGCTFVATHHSEGRVQATLRGYSKDFSRTAQIAEGADLFDALTNAFETTPEIGGDDAQG